MSIGVTEIGTARMVESKAILKMDRNIEVRGGCKKRRNKNRFLALGVSL